MLNKISVLDKGYVAMLPNVLSLNQIRQLVQKGYDIDKIANSIHIHMEIKCPLFVKIMLPEFGITTITRKHIKTELFVPTISEVTANTLDISKEIADDIKATSEALMINPKAYQHDGCDRFVSQVNSPLALYNTLIANGNFNNWLRLIKHSTFPKLIEEYRKAIEDQILAEYQEVINGTVKEKTIDS